MDSRLESSEIDVLAVRRLRGLLKDRRDAILSVSSGDGRNALGVELLRSLRSEPNFLATDAINEGRRIPSLVRVDRVDRSPFLAGLANTFNSFKILFLRSGDGGCFKIFRELRRDLLRLRFLLPSVD